MKSTGHVDCEGGVLVEGCTMSSVTLISWLARVFKISSGVRSMATAFVAIMEKFGNFLVVIVVDGMWLDSTFLRPDYCVIWEVF